MLWNWQRLYRSHQDHKPSPLTNLTIFTPPLNCYVIVSTRPRCESICHTRTGWSNDQVIWPSYFGRAFSFRTVVKQSQHNWRSRQDPCTTDVWRWQLAPVIFKQSPPCFREADDLTTEWLFVCTHICTILGCPVWTGSVIYTEGAMSTTTEKRERKCICTIYMYPIHAGSSIHVCCRYLVYVHCASSHFRGKCKRSA